MRLSKIEEEAFAQIYAMEVLHYNGVTLSKEEAQKHSAVMKSIYYNINVRETLRSKAANWNGWLMGFIRTPPKRF